MDDEKCGCGELLVGVDEVASGMCDHCATWMESDLSITEIAIIEFDDPEQIDDWDLF